MQAEALRVAKGQRSNPVVHWSDASSSHPTGEPFECALTDQANRQGIDITPSIQYYSTKVLGCGRKGVLPQGQQMAQKQAG